jgi:2-polyprenyl-6-methoxyphenol hydroxylase-like FAD-dependent oxidoreductase
MLYTDVAVVGGGLAGSAAAAMLGRAGIDTIVIDPRGGYPADFRCEKLDESQLELLRRTGLADAVLRAATPNDQIWIARLGRLVDKSRQRQVGILYPTLVNAVRAEIPPGVAFMRDKVVTIATSSGRQDVVLSGGETISARLVVLASGLGDGLRRALGIARDDLSACHSISIGFDVTAIGRPGFDFPALTYFPQRTSDRTAYLTLFRAGPAMRANLFVYRGVRDPWLQALRQAPRETLLALMPGLAPLLGAFDVTGPLQVRPVDLYATRGYRQSGVALVGDAFANSCPAAGTGCNKVFTDVERLCHAHIPRWLASDGMGVEKIAAYYDDPVKIACDRQSFDKALRLRALSLENGLGWRGRRWLLFAAHLGMGRLRRVRERVQPIAALDDEIGTPMQPRA